MTKKRSKRAMQATLVLVLILAVTGMGTLAYLTASQSGDGALVNTFIAAGGGQLVDPTDPDNPDPGIDDVNKAFYLIESPATYKDGFYELDLTADKVLANKYEKVMPSMTIAKDPKLTVNLVEGAEAYVFVKVTDTTAGNLTYTMTSDWTEVTGLTLNAGEKVYVYKNAAVTGITEVELNGVELLSGNSVKAADTLTDVDNDEDGMQLGQLKMEAYMCQAGGFTSASEAFSTCF